MGAGPAGWQASTRSQAARAIMDLDPGCFAFVMATGIISAGTSLLGPAWLFGTWWIPLLIVLGLWRFTGRRWPLAYEPGALECRIPARHVQRGYPVARPG